MKSKSEIQEELVALRALVPTGLFFLKTTRLISYAVSELEHPFEASDEWEDLDKAECDMRLRVQDWLEGYRADSPSEHWGTLVEQKI